MNTKSQSRRAVSLLGAIAVLLAACGGGGTPGGGSGGGSSGGSSSGGSSSGGSPPPTQTTTLISDSGRSSFTYMTLNVWANALVWDAANGLIQVVTNNSSPTHANSLLSINPSTGLIVAERTFSADLLAVAVSADGKYIYVGFGIGGDGVQRLDARTLTTDIRIAVGDNSTYIESLSLSPASARTIAVTAHNLMPTMPNGGVAIFDDAVMRPKVLVGSQAYPDPNRGFTNVNATETSWSSDGSTLYAFDPAGGLYQLTVGVDGMDLVNWYAWANTAGYGGRMVGRTAYLDDGRVVNLDGPVHVVGTFAGTYTNSFQRTELLAQRKSFSVKDHITDLIIDGMTLWAFDTETYAPVDSLTFVNVASATFGKLYSWGTNGLVWADPVRLVIGAGSFAEIGGGPPPVTKPATVVAGTVETQAGPITYRLLDVDASDAAADSCGSLFVATRGFSPVHPNSVINMDFDNGTVAGAAYAGSNPNTLAVADDCSAVYAGLDGSNSLVRINRGNMTPDLTVPLEVSGLNGPVRARSITVAPGLPHTIAVSTMADFNCLAVDYDVAIYDEAQKRSINHYGISGQDTPYSVRSVVFGESPSVLYAYDLITPNGLAGLASLAVESTGLGEEKSLADWEDVTGAAMIQDSNRMLTIDRPRGRIYDPFGHVFDTTTGVSLPRMQLNTSPSMVASLCYVPGQTVATDQSTGKVFYLTWDPAGSLYLDTYDGETRSLVDTAKIQFPVGGFGFGYPLRLVRPTADSLAAVLSDGTLLLMQGAILRP